MPPNPPSHTDRTMTGLPPSPSRFNLLVDGEEVQFGIKEKLCQVRRRPKSDWLSSGPAYEYFPTGYLVLELKNERTTFNRRRWKDSDKREIEVLLPSFFRGLAVGTIQIRKQREFWERWHREQEEAQERRKEAERQTQLEAQRQSELEDQASSWVKATKIRELVTAVELEASSRNLSTESHDRLLAWATWARQHADRLDPLKGRLPFEEEDKEAKRSDVRRQTTNLLGRLGLAGYD